MSLLESLLAYEGDFGLTLGSLWGHFGHIDVDLHVYCISYRLVFGPSGPINRKHTFCRRLFLFKETISNLGPAARERAG